MHLAARHRRLRGAAARSGLGAPDHARGNRHVGRDPMGQEAAQRPHRRAHRPDVAGRRLRPAGQPRRVLHALARRRPGRRRDRVAPRRRRPRSRAVSGSPRRWRSRRSTSPTEPTSPPLLNALSQYDRAALVDARRVRRGGRGAPSELGRRSAPRHRARSRGTRHTSALRFSADVPGAVVFVVSSGGALTVARNGRSPRHRLRPRGRVPRPWA